MKHWEATFQRRTTLEDKYQANGADAILRRLPSHFLSTAGTNGVATSIRPESDMTWEAGQSLGAAKNNNVECEKSEFKIGAKPL
jgi:hypothetical protein